MAKTRFIQSKSPDFAVLTANHIALSKSLKTSDLDALSAEQQEAYNCCRDVRLVDFHRKIPMPSSQHDIIRQIEDNFTAWQSWTQQDVKPSYFDSSFVSLFPFEHPDPRCQDVLLKFKSEFNEARIPVDKDIARISCQDRLGYLWRIAAMLRHQKNYQILPDDIHSVCEKRKSIFQVLPFRLRRTLKFVPESVPYLYWTKRSVFLALGGRAINRTTTSV